MLLILIFAFCGVTIILYNLIDYLFRRFDDER